jgi:hypothetical protein
MAPHYQCKRQYGIALGERKVVELTTGDFGYKTKVHNQNERIWEGSIL